MRKLALLLTALAALLALAAVPVQAAEEPARKTVRAVETTPQHFERQLAMRALATGPCNSNTALGAKIYEIRPAGSSITRNIWAKICVVYDDTNVRNSTTINCRTDSGAGCDIRAEVLSARVNEFHPNGTIRTLANDYFGASVSGWSSGWGWQGTSVYVGFTCNDRQYQSRDNDIRVRFGFDGVLRNLGDAWSPRGILTGC